MAFSPTELRKVIAKTTGNFAEAEMKELKTGALNVMRSNEPKVFSEVTLMKQSNKQQTTATYFIRDYKPSKTKISAVHTGELGGTAVKSIKYKPVVQTFDISHKMTQNNQRSYEEILNTKFQQAILNIHRDENKLVVDWLALNKSQVANGGTLMDWNATDFVYENKPNEKEYFGLNMQAAMRSNAYNGAYDIITDQRMYADLLKLGYNGTSNASNTQAQLNGLNPMEEVTLQNTAYSGFGYGMLKGMVGMTSWIPAMNRNGHGSVGENGGFYGTMLDPINGELLAVHITRKGADTQANGGERQDIVDSYQLFRMNAMGTAFLSTANETPIFAFGQKS